MAKSENPAEASSRSQARAARFQSDPGLNPGSQVARGGRVGLGAAHPRLDGPGIAKVRRAAVHPELADTTRSTTFPDQLEADVLDDEDVLDEAAAAYEAATYESAAHESAAHESAHEGFKADALPGARFGQPRLMSFPDIGGAQVPLANLEPPSSARLELTPSPVPRVSLSPATGAVDISLVPGPNMAHSRNLPTLAAQHVLGRRHQRRPAAAVTLPPPGAGATDPLQPSELAHEVRSSRREVVLGLTIGLGLSLLLAVVGQAYLREDVVAGGVAGGVAEAVGETQPAAADLESLTLAARPDTDARGAAWPGAAGTASASSSTAESSTASLPAPAALPAEVPVTGTGAEPPSEAGTVAYGSEPARAGAASSAASAERQQMLAHPGLATMKRRSERVLPRAGRDPSGRSAARARRVPAIAVEPPAFESDKSLSEAARDRTPMSPAESAGLGLDLPL